MNWLRGDIILRTPGVPDGGPAPAGYYLVLKGKSRHGAPLAPYTLTATLEPGAQDLELEPNGKFADPAKQMLASIGATVETTYGKGKTATPKKKP